MEDEEQRYVAKKEGLLTSKLLRGLFGGENQSKLLEEQGKADHWWLMRVFVLWLVLDVTMRCFEEVPGDSISKEAFVCILALFYEYVATLSLQWRVEGRNGGRWLR